jgi:beta-glucanase (GH16 family)
VGGGWPGNPDATTKMPQEMQVDYVRVYAADTPPQTGRKVRQGVSFQPASATTGALSSGKPAGLATPVSHPS